MKHDVNFRFLQLSIKLCDSEGVGNDGLMNEYRAIVLYKFRKNYKVFIFGARMVIASVPGTYSAWRNIGRRCDGDLRRLVRESELGDVLSMRSEVIAEQITKMRTASFFQPQRLVFGCGCLKECVEYIRQLAPAHLRILTNSVLEPVTSRIQSELSMIATSVDMDIPSEPTISDFEAATERAREVGTTCVLGLGGGSVLDIAKLVAAFVDGKQRIAETFGIGLLGGRKCHLICMPTTSGTGSEVSPNAILLDETAKLKKAVISPYLVPDAVFVDPELTLTVLPAVTAATGLDALAHCLESYTNKFAHPLVDIYALEGVGLCGRFLLRAVQCPNDIKAREGMALASLYGGLCLGPVNTTAGHAIAYPLGSEYHISHGVSVALVQPHVFRFNARSNPARHAAVARALGTAEGSSDLETALLGASAISTLTTECGLDPHLGSYGVDEAAVPALAKSAMTVTRLLRNNPRTVTEEDCAEIYRACF